jgi:RNA-directed DNA polymerase
MMESEVTGNCHASFGERDGETRRLKDLKVRFVPTLSSPLLANIALHGMEERITQAFPRQAPSRENGGNNRQPPYLIRYADDFVVIHEELHVVQQCQQILCDWLAQIGLKLHPDKTRITHTLHPYAIH